MSMTPYSGGGDVSSFVGDEGTVGLEDIGATDVVVPRLRIAHDEGTFVEKNSGFETKQLRCIILGMTKQRIFWRGDIDEGDRPACKSTDFVHGFPNLDPRTSEDKRFPVEESNFNLADYPPNPEMNNLVTLPCNTCVFAQWTKKAGKNIPPLCSEQHTFPLLYTPDDGESWITALLTVQKTGIKPSKQYLSYFAQTRNPMFTVETVLTLDTFKRGMVTYSVPKFKRGNQTDPEMWSQYADSARSLRDFLRQPPTNYEEEAVTTSPTSQAWDEEAAAAPAAKPAPTATAAPVAVPVSTPAPAPAAAPEPVAAPVAATPAPAPAPAPAPEQDDDDDLPF